MSAAATVTVRDSVRADAAAVAAAVAALLDELGGSSPSLGELEAEAATLIGDASAGALLVAEQGGTIVGVLQASWQRAIHVPGAYATIQDLWVDPAHRGGGVGAELIEALAARARERGVPRIEVGLPRETFPGLARTEAFYRGAGFDPLGPRMRRLL